MTFLAWLWFFWLPLTQRADAVLEGAASFALGQRGQVCREVEE